MNEAITILFAALVLLLTIIAIEVLIMLAAYLIMFLLKRTVYRVRRR